MGTQNRSDSSDRIAEENSPYGSSGFWWTVCAIALVAIGRVLPEVQPSWFVDPTGQVGGEGMIVSFVGILVVAGLLYGSRVARWVMIAYLGFDLFWIWEMLTIPGFRETGWLTVAALNGAALGILLFLPAVKQHFSGDEHMETQGEAQRPTTVDSE